jgi:hypothetical protein
VTLGLKAGVNFAPLGVKLSSEGEDPLFIPSLF